MNIFWPEAYFMLEHSMRIVECHNKCIIHNVFTASGTVVSLKHIRQDLTRSVILK
jgi:hypothetical protein